jgi:hypothetical protein
MASPLAQVQEALRAFGAAGRPPVPSSAANSSLSDLEPDFPALRHDIWATVLSAVASSSAARVPSKYTRKLADELVFGLQVASALVARGESRDGAGGRQKVGNLRRNTTPTATMFARRRTSGWTTRCTRGCG